MVVIIILVERKKEYKENGIDFCVNKYDAPYTGNTLNALVTNILNENLKNQNRFKKHLHLNYLN